MRDHLPPPGSSDHRPAPGWSVPGRPDRVRARTRGWMIFGIVLAVAMALAGLVVVGVAIVFFVGLSHWGSNK